jgi:hypothetical protein
MAHHEDAPWTVWGDSREPVKIGTEAEVKQFVVEGGPSDDYYIQSPNGQELMYEPLSGKWVRA